jgi:hypothetical protein
MSYRAPRTNRQVRIRCESKKISLLLGTYGSEGLVVNNSLTFNLANELRRFFEMAIDPCDLSLQITEGDEVLLNDYPKPDGWNVLDAADLIAARSRLQCSLDNLMSSRLQGWIDQEEHEATKLSLLQLIQSCDEEIKLKLPGPTDERHDSNGDVRS